MSGDVIDWDALSDEQLKDAVDAMEAIEKYDRENKIEAFVPYKKQEEFFQLSLTLRELMLCAGNQLGKTMAGAVKMAYHLTGEYPPDWKGRRFTKPVRAWAAGVTNQLVRDVSQKLLCGDPEYPETSYGTGFIRKRCLVGDPTRARTIANAFDSITVEHRTNGVVDGNSILRFKSYEQGREKFQGDTIDIIWLDEEPDMDIYSECLARITATGGYLYTTFTPLKGMTEMVKRFFNEQNPERGKVIMTVYDASIGSRVDGGDGHMTPEKIASTLAGYRAHERETRAMGIPLLGEGAVFDFPDEVLYEQGMSLDAVPLEWRKIWGIDFGISHPFAAILMAIDQGGCVHVLHTIRVKGQTPLEHAQAIKTVAADIPIAWPHDGNTREKSNGIELQQTYKDYGLKMLPEHSTWQTGGYGVEAGLLDIEMRAKTGRLKVAQKFSDWFAEKRQLHREDGELVKIDDDLLSATRQCLMMLRKAKALPLGPKQSQRGGSYICKGVDFDLI